MTFIIQDEDIIYIYSLTNVFMANNIVMSIPDAWHILFSPAVKQLDLIYSLQQYSITLQPLFFIFHNKTLLEIVI